MFIRQYFIIGLILLLLLNPLSAQNLNWNPGGTIGISATFGTKINRVGILFGAFIVLDHVQVNTYFNRFYCFNNLGPDLRRIENQLNFGLTGAFGPTVADTSSDFIFFSPISNFTGKKHSISYVYKIYTDNISTSQNTGIIGFQSGNFQFYTENDLFIFKGNDKYRTGALSFTYQYQNALAGITCLLWTGHNQDEKAVKIPPGEGYISQFGHYDLSETKYGRHSHGILALYASYALPYMQTVSATAGIDAEQIRHGLQNKVLHDMPFLPRKWKTVNPHFPMLDTEGKSFLNKKDQKIRKPLFFGTMSLNPVLFY